MISPEARAACAKYVAEQVRHVLETFAPRTPGSAAERETQAYIAECLQGMAADEVVSEPFPVAAEAFMRFQVVAGWLLILGFAAYWLAPPLALLLGIAAFAVTWYQFVHYRLLLDPLYPASESCNVYASWAPTGERKRRFILNAHTDAAFEWRYHQHWPRAFPWLVRYGLVSMPAVVVTQVIATLIWMGQPDSVVLLYLGAVQALFLPSFVLALFFTDFNHTVPGANDNLTGVFTALGVVKALRDAKTPLENTELACLITGAEEAGLRGAKAWAAAHRQELRDCETVILTLDTLHDLNHLTIYQGDLNGTVKNDAALGALVQQAAAACGRDARIGTIPLGATDAAAFTRAGLKATALVAMDPAPARFYHTRRDNTSAIDTGCIAVIAGIVAEAIHRFDATGTAAGGDAPDQA